MAKYILGDIFQGDYPVTQGYGANPQYYAQFGLAGHEGIDFGTPNGTPILAPFDGVILRDVDMPGDKDYGDFIVVWDQKQLCAVWFCHLQDNNVVLGQSVKKGDVLGHTDNTGNTTGAHLHLNFVETDAQGNRLNKDNGYQGFLNALDPNLVQWVLGGAQTSVPSAPVQNTGVYVDSATFEMLVTKATNSDNFASQGYHSVDDVNNKVNSLIAHHNADTAQIDSLTQQLKDALNKPPVVASISQFKGVVYSTWSILPGQNNWTNRLHQLKKIFEIGHL